MAAVAMLLVAAAPATATDLIVCTSGTGAGECIRPRGVAVDLETNQIYVADQGNHRIDVFEANEGEGKVKFLSSFGAAQLSNPSGVAVDNEPASTAHHDVYVFDAGVEKVKRFSAGGVLLKESEPPLQFHDVEDQIASGGGSLYVGDLVNFDEKTEILKLSPELDSEGKCVLAHADRLNSGLAVGAGGEIYGAFNKGGGVLKFEFAGPVCGEVTAPYPLSPNLGQWTLGIDATGDLYAAEVVPRQSGGGIDAITEFSPSGAILRRYGFGSLGGLNNAINGIAPLATTLGDVVVSERAGTVRYLKEPPPGPVIAPPEARAGNVRATLEAEIDPEGKASEYSFEWVDQHSFETEGGFASPKTKSTLFASLPGPPDFELKGHLATTLAGCVTASKESIENETCLRPDTEYRYRVRAKNADGEGNSPVEGTFTTKPPIAIEQTFASEVGTDSARLTTVVNPLGISATGFFEYVTESSCLKDEEELGAGHCFDHATEAPDVAHGAAPLDFGGGEVGVRRSVSVTLAPGTAYRVRVVATDQMVTVPQVGEAARFSTFPSEGSEACPNEAFRGALSGLLPDCRAYELVSPLDKEGGDIAVVGDQSSPLVKTALTESSSVGSRFAYASYRAFGDASAAPFSAQYIAERTPGGWRSRYALGPRGRVNVIVIGEEETELRALSPDLCQAWVHSYAEPPLAPKGLAGQMNLYRHPVAGEGCGPEGWEALTTAAPPHGAFGTLELQGTSADGSAAIYAARDNLTAEAPELGEEESTREFGLYYQEAGEGPPRFVCFGTDGKPIAVSCAAGTTEGSFALFGRGSNLTGAISADDRRVFWSTPAGTTGSPKLGKLFVRENPGQPQSKLDAEGHCSQPARACTIAVSAKGEELSGSEDAQFWGAAEDGSAAIYTTGKTLYRFDVDTEATIAIASKVLGVMGAGRDLSRVYFASEEALSTEANSAGKMPVPGRANIYLAELGGPTRFVATLAGAADPSGQANPISTLPAQRDSRVSGDGMTAAFTSAASLTGYDNTDAGSGRADAEGYLYEAGRREGKGELICASCNPSGGRPMGTLRRVGQSENSAFWGAAWLPVWKTSLYPGRVMSENGERLYFEASDALVPRDTDGATDVYQWEASGAGGCSEQSTSYSPQDQGCVSLISSGQGSGESTLLDTDDDGENVFFSTGSSLLPPDYGLVDIYDARVDGGLPEPALPSPGCEGEACQTPPAGPNDPTPASSSLEGPGNVREERTKPPKCAKGKVRKNERCAGRQQHKKAHKKKHGRAKEGAHGGRSGHGKGGSK